MKATALAIMLTLFFAIPSGALPDLIFADDFEGGDPLNWSSVVGYQAPVCVAEGTGIYEGDNIADFSLSNCSGTSVSLHSRCSVAKGVLVVHVAGWDPAGTALIGSILSGMADELSQGLDLMVVLGEDPAGQTPSFAYCAVFAAANSLSDNQIFIDGGWSLTRANIYAYPTSGTDFMIPWTGLLDGDNMLYVYGEGEGSGNLGSAVAQVMAD
ncbi:MAG: hypothetical protein K8R59_00875 [Thermoanaerobaculales bacterium]|nr:hypothetical protein [Thermoanaerobaculales bacterium]